MAPKPHREYGHTIIIKVTPGAVYASIQGAPDISAVGQHEAAAIGALLLTHAPKLGIRILRHD